MKKLIIIFSIVLFTASFASAQSQVYFGVGATGMSTWITNQNNYGAPDMDYVSRFGFAGNLNLGFDFNKHLGVKTEIGFSSLGEKYKDATTDSTRVTFNSTRDINLNYLQIPILFKFRTGGEKVRFFAAIGPQFDILMSAKQIYKLEGKEMTEPVMIENEITKQEFDMVKKDIKERYKSMHIMGRVDLGMEFQLCPHMTLDAGLSLAYGFSDINAEDYRIKDISKNYAASNNLYGGVQLGLNYMIPLGGK